MAKLTASWEKAASADSLQRSSQVLSVIGDTAYIFGGELEPRKPRDNHVHAVKLAENASTSNPIKTLTSTTASPSPRVGSASTTLHGRMYLFSGRGGTAMSPIEENGAFHVFDSTTSDWTFLSPADPAEPFPGARSYHCLANDNNDTIYIHAGCPENGRLSDLWSFQVFSRYWTKLTSAPDPPRGGTSIASSEGLLFRTHGFDGKTEQGGSLDIYSPALNDWSTISYAPDNKSGPIPSSVSTLLAVTIAGRPSLVTLFGELDPSALGHAGAGKMSSYIWVYDIEEQVWSAAVETNAGTSSSPVARGWFAADVFVSSGSEERVVVQGGLGGDNERLDDIWILTLRMC